MLLSLFRSRVSRRPRVARALSSSAAPSPSCLEPLETRRLLAADPGGTAALAGGVLEVKGTRRADEIRVDLNGTTGQLDVTINGAAAGSFNTADAPGGVRVDAGGGNDSVLVGPAVTLATLLRGGKGNDTLTGGGGSDDIDGEAGRDACDGGSGDDSVKGGAGNDSVTGSAGDDSVRGDAGRDLARGGDGDDDLDGGSGNDDCDGGAGDDRVRGDRGRDRVRGALGDDDVDGGAGNDDLGGDDGHDRLRGGDGRDSCDGGAGDDDVDGGRGRDRVRGGDGRDSFDDAFDDDRDRDHEFDDRGDDDGQHIPADQLPQAVRAAFDQRFPGVTIREVERENEDAGIEYKIDFINAQGQRVRAEFTEAGQFIRQDFRDAGVSVGNDDDDDDDNGGGNGDGQHIAFDQVPAAVRSAFDAQFPGVAVREVETEIEHGVRVYKIDFINGQGQRWRARFTESGQMFRQELRDGDDDNGGGGGDDDGGGSGSGGDDNSGPGGGGDNGGDHDGQQISYGQLPEAVRTAFEQRYPGANVGEVERENEDEGVIYKIDFTLQGNRIRAEFTEAGQFLRDEDRD